MKTHAPGHRYTIAAAAAISKHILVGMTGAVCGADAKPLGVSEVDVASGEQMSVITSGVVLCTTGAAVSAGAKLESDSAGKVVTWATSGEVVGWALDAASGANEVIRVRLD